MNTLERWDILVQFLDGPLAMRGDIEMLGPTIHIGMNPGPTGFKLEGYRGLDGRQAVITVYSGSSISIAPIGNLQTRVSNDQHVNWSDIHPINGPVYLSEGDAVHLGPPGRGATFILLRARRVGEWQQGGIVSSVSGGEAPNTPPPPQIKEIKVNRGIPFWFIPAIFGMFGFFTLSLGMVIFTFYYTRPSEIGPIEEGVAYFDIRESLDEMLAKESALTTTQLSSSAFKGVDGGFEIFIAAPDLIAAGRSDAKTSDQKYWDPKLLEWVKRSVKVLAGYKSFWRRLDEIRADYAYVLTELRKADMPDALAAIPYQESNYRPLGNNFVCAAGYWQFLPEVAKQSGIPIASCTISGREAVWEPKDFPPVGILKNAVYINRSGKTACLLKGCKVDERSDLIASTKGAVISLGRAWKDQQIRASGSAVQIVIASHNAGYDHSEFAAKEGVKHQSGLRWKYKKWVEVYNKPAFSPDFIGANINCETGGGGEAYDPNRTCNTSGTPALLGVETQHYVHLIIAQHLLAACYYGQNYSAEFEAFKPYEELSMSGGYCKSFAVPRPESLKGAK